MKDKGIFLLTGFVAAISGCIGFGIGDSLVRYASINKAFAGPDRLQWEVMLTGLAAIAGGYMAYRGATDPIKHARQQELIEFKYTTRNVINDFLRLTDPTSGVVDSIFKILKLEEDGKRDYITSVTTDIASRLPEVPTALVSERILYEREAALSAIRGFTSPPHGRLGSTLASDASDHARLQVLRYMDTIEKYF